MTLVRVAAKETNADVLHEGKYFFKYRNHGLERHHKLQAPNSGREWGLTQCSFFMIIFEKQRNVV